MDFKNILLCLSILLFQACQGGVNIEHKVDQTQKSDIFAIEEKPSKNTLPDSIYLVELAKNIIADKWKYPGSDARDENMLPSMVHRLETDNPVKRSFWFLAISKLLPKTDGALSEILSLSIYGYIEEDPVEFFKLLSANNTTIPASTNLKEWVNCVGMEIQIEHEGEEEAAQKKYVKAIKKKCSTITGAEKKLLDEFVQLLQG
jgi:hypothetical protein